MKKNLSISLVTIAIMLLAAMFLGQSSSCTTGVDSDGDMIPDAIDNCDFVQNPYQTDGNGNGVGDDCEYSQTFTYGQSASSSQCTAWNDFRNLLNGSYTKVTISGSIDPIGVACNGSTADLICKALKAGQAGSWSCDGRTWMVGICGAGLELSAAGSICQCPTSNYIIRPCIGNGNPNWGGVNSATCNAPSQTINVFCQ